MPVRANQVANNARFSIFIRASDCIVSRRQGLLVMDPEGCVWYVRSILGRRGPDECLALVSAKVNPEKLVDTK